MRWSSAHACFLLLSGGKFTTQRLWRSWRTSTLPLVLEKSAPTRWRTKGWSGDKGRQIDLQKMRLIFNVLKLSVCSLPSKIVSGWTCRSIRRAGWPSPPLSSPSSGHITFLGLLTSLFKVWLMTCRDNLKINVRESAEMDQADLELRATIMKVLRCINNYLDPSTNKE